MLIVSVTYIMIILFFLIVFYLKLTFGFDYIMKCEGIEKELKWHLLYYGNLSLILWKYISYIMEIYLLYSGNTSLIFWKYISYHGNTSLISWKYISYIMENRIVFSAVCLHSCSHYLLSLYLV